MRAIVLGVIAAAIAGSAAAAPVSVVQFSQTSAANDVTGANNPLLTGATGASTITISNAVANISQLLGNPAVNGVDVNLSATSIDNATTVGASGILQHYDGTFCLSSGPNCTGIDFLSGSFSDAAFGTAAGSQLTVNIANPPDTLSLTSAVIPASQVCLAHLIYPQRCGRLA